VTGVRVAGRLRFALPIDTDNARYESSREERNIDYAVRWESTIGDWDMGLSHFNGTSREPRFEIRPDGQALLPVYNLIEQWGLDLQATLGDWLWKAEIIRRSGQLEAYIALTTGFEYTFAGIMESAVDLGILSEVLYDERGCPYPLC